MTGQTWTTLGKLRSAKSADGRGKKYRNVFEKVEQDEKVYEIWTEPKVGAIWFASYWARGRATDILRSSA